MSDVTNLLITQQRRDHVQRREIKDLSIALFYLIAEVGQYIRTEAPNLRPLSTIPDLLAEKHPDLVDALETACNTLGEDHDWWTSHILDACDDI